MPEYTSGTVFIVLGIFSICVKPVKRFSGRSDAWADIRVAFFCFYIGTLWLALDLAEAALALD